MSPTLRRVFLPPIYRDYNKPLGFWVTNHFVLLSQQKSEAERDKIFIFKVWVLDVNRVTFSRQQGHQCLQRLDSREEGGI